MKYEDYQLEDFLQDEFFVKWVSNPTPENEYFWSSWIGEHPQKEELVFRAREIISSVDYKNKIKANNKDYFEVLENIHKGRKSQYAQPKTVEWYPGNAGLLKYAAIIAFLIVAGVSGWFVFDKMIKSQNDQGQLAVNKEIRYEERQTKKGEKLTLKLPDGSEVKLNAESRIRYSENFGQPLRDVFLEGEAFFKVARDTSKPFIIHTGDVATKVLGTSFNISAYPDKKELEVAVVEGKVQVDNNTKEIKGALRSVLLANDVYTYDKVNQASSTQNMDISDRVGWKDGVIVIEEAGFEEIIKILERWYGVEFDIEPGVKVPGSFSGRFENKSLETVLEGFSFSSNIIYTINGKKITLKKTMGP